MSFLLWDPNILGFGTDTPHYKWEKRHLNGILSKLPAAHRHSCIKTLLIPGPVTLLTPVTIKLIHLLTRSLAHSFLGVLLFFCCNQILNKSSSREKRFWHTVSSRGIDSIMARKAWQQEPGPPSHKAFYSQETEKKRKWGGAINLKARPQWSTSSIEIPAL